MKPDYRSLSLEEIQKDWTIKRPISKKKAFDLLENISRKVHGISNISTFADNILIRDEKRLRSDVSKEYLAVSVFDKEVPGNTLRNDGSSPNPMDYNYLFLYPLKNINGDVAEPSIGVSGRDVTQEELGSYGDGNLYGTVKTFQCNPLMTCTECNGNGRCKQCHGNGEERCPVCGGRGTCMICAGRGEIRCDICGGKGYSDGGKCSHCSGKGFYTCSVCGGSGNCSICRGSGLLTCGRCGGSGVCVTCRGDGQITCTRCNGTGYYQTLMGFRSRLYAKRLHFPPMSMEMSDFVRNAKETEWEGVVYKKWTDCRTVEFDKSAELTSLIPQEASLESPNIKKEKKAILHYYEQMEDSLKESSELDVPYMNTWSVAYVPDTIISFSVCDENYRIHIIGEDYCIAFSDFPMKLSIFDNEGQSVHYSIIGGAFRKIALAKLAAYIFNADDENLDEANMMTRICHAMGYSNVERWWLLSILKKYGPQMPFSTLTKQISPILRSKKTLCFAWHCIGVDHAVSEKELEVFNNLVKEFNLNDKELQSLKDFTESKFSRLPENQIIKEYIESEPRKVSVRKIISMIVSGIAFIISFICQFIVDTSDTFTVVLLGVSFASLLLSIPFKRQMIYTEKKTLIEPRPNWVYYLIAGGVIFSTWWYFHWIN